MFFGIIIGSILLKIGTVKTWFGLKLFTGIIEFVFRTDVWIVNISIAELQSFIIFNLEGWMYATGRFVTGVQSIDTSIFLIFVTLMGIGIYHTYKKDFTKLSFM